MLAPWTIYASGEEGRFIPVTKGSAAALFVGTYLPGGGTTIGMKEHLEAQLRAKHPEYDGIKTYKIPAADALELFAAKHPDLPRDVALNQEAKKNLIHYSTTQPLAFAKMQWAKAKRMWFFYYRGGGVHYISTPMRIWQVVLVLAAGIGLLAGLIRRRDPLLGAVLITLAFSTPIHTIVVSQARYNLPLMPTLIAAGVAGWFLALRRRREAPEAETAHDAAWNSDTSASGAPSATAPAVLDAIEALGLRRVLARRQPERRAGARRTSRRPRRCRSLTGILNVWQHDPADVARAHAELTREHPDRFLLGIGIGHPEATSDYTRPLKTMREFFDGLDAAEPCRRTSASPPRSGRRCSTSPRSARSAPTRTSSTPEHTRFARERLGPDALVAPEVAVVVEEDPETARAHRPRVREPYLGLTTTRATCSSSATPSATSRTAARTA